MYVQYVQEFLFPSLQVKAKKQNKKKEEESTFSTAQQDGGIPDDYLHMIIVLSLWLCIIFSLFRFFFVPKFHFDQVNGKKRRNWHRHSVCLSLYVCICKSLMLFVIDFGLL